MPGQADAQAEHGLVAAEDFGHCSGREEKNHGERTRGLSILQGNAAVTGLERHTSPACLKDQAWRDWSGLGVSHCIEYGREVPGPREAGQLLPPCARDGRRGNRAEIFR